MSVTEVATGSRLFPDRPGVFRVLAESAARVPSEPFRLGFGDCPTGGDLFFHQWAFWAAQAQPRISFRRYAANWTRFGPSAGPRRNREMIDTEKPSRVLAFFYGPSRGTLGCALYARQQGIPVHCYIFRDGRTVEVENFLDGYRTT